MTEYVIVFFFFFFKISISSDDYGRHKVIKYREEEEEEENKGDPTKMTRQNEEENLEFFTENVELPLGETEIEVKKEKNKKVAIEIMEENNSPSIEVVDNEEQKK